MKSFLRVLLCCGLLSSSFASPALSAEPAPDADLFPESTVIYAQLSGAKKLAANVYDNPLRDRIEALPAYQQFVESPEYKQFDQGRSFLEGMIGMPIREAWETYAAGGIVAGVDGKSRGVAAIVRGKDAESMRQLRDKVIGLMMMGEGGRPINQVEYRGVEAHRSGDLRLALYEERLVVTNNSELGRSILDGLLDGNDNALANNTRFQEAWSTRPSDSSIWAFADLETIRDSGIAQDAYERQINNPVLEVLVGGIQSSLQHTPYATGALISEPDRLATKLSIPHQSDWVPESRDYFFGPEGDGRAPELPQVNETLFTLSTYRDFSEMWMRAGDLFNEDINDDFAQADANLTTIFAGRDFGEDILGSLQPEVGFIATRQSFEGRLPTPAIKLPSFAIVAKLRKPETMRRELRRTFQSLVGFFNVIGAMNGQNQLELDMEKLEGEAELVSATYVPEEGDEESTSAPIVFNFSPTVGFSGDQFVLASDKQLCETLTLAKPTEAATGDNTRSRLNASVLKDVLADNREQLIAQNMLEEGRSREEAEAAIDFLLELVTFFKDASVRLTQEDGRLDLSLQVRMQS